MLTPTKINSGKAYQLNGMSVWLDQHYTGGKTAVIRYKSEKWPVGKTDVVKFSDLREVVKPRAGINKVAEKRAEENKEYLKLRKPFLVDHPRCEINVPGCTIKATEVHHAAGRVGKKLISVETFVAACNNCHRWAENEPEAAKEMGVSINRL